MFLAHIAQASWLQNFDGANLQSLSRPQFVKIKDCRKFSFGLVLTFLESNQLIAGLKGLPLSSNVTIVARWVVTETALISDFWILVWVQSVLVALQTDSQK